jgi:type III pantothenate kinase
MDLVLDIGNSQIKGALFQDKALLHFFTEPVHPFPQQKIAQFLEGKSVDRTLIASVNGKIEEVLKADLQQRKIKYHILNYKELKLVLDVDEPEQLGHDRIANAYGALVHFPINDCIIVDIGTAITVDFVAKEGHYLGGMIYPGANLCAKALADYTDKLPLVSLEKPESALAKTTKTHLQSGIYYGQLGAVERMIAEISLSALSPSSVKILATGGATRFPDFAEDLKELVDVIDPQLTFLGLREILEETYLKKKE